MMVVIVCAVHGVQYMVYGLSHARTVVRQCCKGDDESQWERGKFDPPPPKNPLTDGHWRVSLYFTMGWDMHPGSS